METELIFWLLKKHGKDRGYDLPKGEWKKLIPHSEKEMLKKFDEWLLERKQEGELKGHQTSSQKS